VQYPQCIRACTAWPGPACYTRGGYKATAQRTGRTGNAGAEVPLPMVPRRSVVVPMHAWHTRGEHSTAGGHAAGAMPEGPAAGHGGYLGGREGCQCPPGYPEVAAGRQLLPGALACTAGGVATRHPGAGVARTPLWRHACPKCIMIRTEHRQHCRGRRLAGRQRGAPPQSAVMTMSGK